MSGWPDNKYTLKERKLQKQKMDAVIFQRIRANSNNIGRSSSCNSRCMWFSLIINTVSGSLLWVMLSFVCILFYACKDTFLWTRSERPLENKNHIRENTKKCRECCNIKSQSNYSVIRDHYYTSRLACLWTQPPPFNCLYAWILYSPRIPSSTPMITAAVK